MGDRAPHGADGLSGPRATDPPKARVLVVGGTGVFGGLLAQALLAWPDVEVLVAGRSLDKARAFCARHGGTPCAIDRGAPDLADRLRSLAPRVIVDAAGPFQAYGAGNQDPYALARAAIAIGAHHIDLSDDAGFTAGIAALDSEAQAQGVAVISGASSVPGLSSAAVVHLAEGLDQILSIESAIMPGNRAPRGLSVVQAILAQAGHPVAHQEGGRPATAIGWSDPRRESLEVPGVAPVQGRWTSPIGAPDLALFPARFQTGTVRFRAGLELPLLHLGLWAIAFPVRWGWLRSLVPLARPLRAVADLLEPFGTDRGGMRVEVVGTTPTGAVERRTWTLIAEGGDGPRIPTLVARVLCRAALDGRLAPGARACLGEATLQEVIEEAQGLRLHAAVHTEEIVPLFAAALGTDALHALPAPVRALHTAHGTARFTGQADIDGATHLLGRFLRRAFGFPSAGRDVPLVFDVQREGHTEVWTRTFDGQAFRSVLSLAGPVGSGRVFERFGPFRFELALTPTPDGVAFPVTRGWFLGVPWPRWLMPTSFAGERARDGVYRFDVDVRLPLIGRLMHYRGWLAPATPSTAEDSTQHGGASQEPAPCGPSPRAGG